MKKSHETIRFGATLALLFLFLSPALLTGYLGDDDHWFSLVHGFLGYDGLSPAEALWKQNRLWLNRGRFFPLQSIQTVVLFYLVPSAWVYKAVLIVLVMLSLAAFHRLMIELEVRSPVRLFVPLCLVSLLQFRLYHDPVLGAGGMLPILFIEIVGSLIFLIRFLKTRSRPALIISLVLHAMALLTYEIAYPLLLLSFIIVARERALRKERIAVILPHLIVTLFLVFVAGLVYFRAVIAGLTVYPGIKPGFELGAIARTFVFQVLSPLPLSYPLLSSRASLSMNFSPGWQVLAVLVFLMTFLLAVAALKEMAGDKRSSSPRGFFWLAGVLWIVPALPIALSSKYQQELGPGLGYTPVFIQAFGVAMLLTQAVVWAGSKLGFPRAIGYGGYALAGGLSLLTLTTFSVNHAVVAELMPAKMRRENLRVALENGVLDLVPPHSWLLIARPSTFWNNFLSQYFYYQHSGKRFRTAPFGDEMGQVPADYWTRWTESQRVPAGAEIFVVNDDVDREGRGYVVVASGKISEAGIGRPLWLERIWFFARDLPSPQAGNLKLMDLATSRTWNRLEVIKSGGEGGLYSVPLESPYLADPRGLKVISDLPM